MVELFLQLYFKYFNPHWPLVDPVTFRSNDARTHLTIAMCCIGAMYDSNIESHHLAAAAVLAQRPALLSKMVIFILIVRGFSDTNGWVHPGYALSERR